MSAGSPRTQHDAASQPPHATANLSWLAAVCWHSTLPPSAARASTLVSTPTTASARSALTPRRRAMHTHAAPLSAFKRLSPATIATRRLENGLRALLVHDPEAAFAACCASVQAGYFDDPPSLPGLAHYLEHAVHLGSDAFPGEGNYKAYLAQHGGSSNASTSGCPWHRVARA